MRGDQIFKLRNNGWIVTYKGPKNIITVWKENRSGKQGWKKTGGQDYEKLKKEWWKNLSRLLMEFYWWGCGG